MRIINSHTVKSFFSQAVFGCETVTTANPELFFTAQSRTTVFRELFKRCFGQNFTLTLQYIIVLKYLSKGCTCSASKQDIYRHQKLSPILPQCTVTINATFYLICVRYTVCVQIHMWCENLPAVYKDDGLNSEGDIFWAAKLCLPQISFSLYIYEVIINSGPSIFIIFKT